MKKIIATLILFSILIFSSVDSFAQTSVKAYFKDIKYVKGGTSDKVTLYSSNYKGYKVTYLPNPDRIIVDIPNNIVKIKGLQTIKVNSSVIKNIRYSQFTKSNARVVFDVSVKPTYKIEKKSGALVLTLSKPVSKSELPVSKPPEINRGDIDRSTAVYSKILFSSSGSINKVVLSGENYDEYSSMRLTGPDRIVIDISNCTVPVDQQVMNVDNNLVKDVRYAQLNPNTARIVVDTVGQPQYFIEKQQEKLAIYFQNPTYKNIIYNNNNNRIYFSLNGIKLTEITTAVTTEGTTDETSAEAADLEMLYSGSYDESGKKYTVSFPDILADIGTGILQINDGVLESVEITNDTVNNNTLVTFNSNYNLIYSIITNPNDNDTEITVLKPYTNNDNLVVIDAGHGGSDSGAKYADIEEKNLNLQIALKLNEILKSKDIKTYMTRYDDTFIPLENRANYANDLNAALFLSIHNNAFNISEYGTETLCYPSDKSREFAHIVQDSLVSALGTQNRGVVDRPNLVVLYSTKMPAVISEIAFITNPDDRLKLLDDEFIQNSAIALSNAIINALDSMTKGK